MNTKGLISIVLLSIVTFGSVTGNAIAGDPLKANCDAQKRRSAVFPDRSPVIGVREEGFYIFGPASIKSVGPISLSSVRSALLSLKASEWPNGCFVNFGQSGPRSMGSKEVQEDNEQKLNDLLNEIGIMKGFIT